MAEEMRGGNLPKDKIGYVCSNCKCVRQDNFYDVPPGTFYADPELKYGWKEEIIIAMKTEQDSSRST